MSGMSPQDRHRAFWDRMARCPTVEALERDFARERRLEGAAQATVEAFIFSLRDRGIAALAEPDPRRWLAELSDLQVEQVLGRLLKLRGSCPVVTDDLIAIIAEQLE